MTFPRDRKTYQQLSTASADFAESKTGSAGGHLSDTFVQWTELGTISEVDVTLEAVGGTGSIDFSTVKMTVY